jgi:hypothetical protein
MELIIDSDINVVSDSFKSTGGKHEVTCWATTWGGAQIQIQKHVKSPQTDEWITLRDTVTGIAKVFNADEQAIIDMVASGSELRAVLTGATGTTNNVNCILRGTS